MPKKAVYLRFELISRKKARRLLRMSKKSSNFAVRLCALAELICNNNYNNIVQQLFLSRIRSNDNYRGTNIVPRQGRFIKTKIIGEIV